MSAHSAFVLIALSAATTWGLLASFSHTGWLWQAASRYGTFRTAFRGELWSSFTGCLYLLLGGASAAILTSIYDVSVSSWLYLDLRVSSITFLAIAGELGLTALLADGLIYAFRAKPGEARRQILEIPWMKSVIAMRSWRRPIAIGVSALIEEFFFRGIMIAIAIDLLQFDGWAAIMLSGILFIVQQAVQLRTLLQLVLISSSCIAISLIGGLAVLVSHSLVPALIAHATFVIFYGARLGNLDLETSLRASPGH